MRKVVDIGRNVLLCVCACVCVVYTFTLQQKLKSYMHTCRWYILLCTIGELLNTKDKEECTTQEQNVSKFI